MSESNIRVGAKAPAFELPDQDGVAVSLSSLRWSWVVLYFYPKDDTPGCTTEACEFSEGIEALRDLDAVVLGCSADSPEKHRAFIAKHGLAVRLLSDRDHEVMEAYGAWGAEVDVRAHHHGGDPVDSDHRPHRPGRVPLAQGQGRGPRR